MIFGSIIISEAYLNKRMCNMKLYKFRPLKDDANLDRIKDIIEHGFYCCDFLKFNDMNEGVFTISHKNIKIDVSGKQKYKICSFSGVNALNSQLMWGHYSNAGMGIVIEVDVSQEKCNQIKQVKYTNSTEKLNTIEQILTRKSEEWKYEDEFRYLTTEANNEIKIGDIVKVYFGTPYKELVNYDDIKNKHKKLGEYLKLKGKLHDFCKEKNIQLEDYKFN